MAQICSATSKTTGNQCKQPVVPGREVCRFHGGKTPRGLALPQTKSGRYSKDLPQRLIARYQESLDDQDQLVLSEEIAMVDSLLVDAVGRLKDDESWSWVKRVREAWGRYNEAAGVGDEDEILRARNHLADVIEGAGNEFAAWDELGRMVDRRMRLVESERKRLIEAQRYLTLGQVMLLVGALTDAVRQNVSDPPALAAIDRRFAELLGSPINA